MNFWEMHGVFFIFFMFFFPRLTLLFSSVAFGGFFWWLGLIFAPRILVAILATSTYWYTNTILVVLTWFWAVFLESGEKHIVTTRKFPHKRRNEDIIIDVEAKK